MLPSVRKALDLAAITGKSRESCAQYLKENGFDLPRTLMAMIEAGDVAPDQLNRDACPPDLLAAAEAKAAEADASRSAAAAAREAEVRALAATLAGQDFPTLTSGDHGDGHGQILLPSWTDCYLALSHGKPAPDAREPGEWLGIYGLTVNRAAPSGGRPRWTQPQRRAYTHLRRNEPAAGRAVLDALFRFYRDEVIPRRADWISTRQDPAEMERRLPDVTSPQEMRRLVEPNGLFVWRRAKDGAAYTGWSFACAWDDEHGAGVVTHLDRAIFVGDASDAFEEEGLEDGGGGDEKELT